MGENKKGGKKKSGFEDLQGILSDDALSLFEEWKEIVDQIQVTDDEEKTETSPEVMKKILIVVENCSLIIQHLKKGKTARIEFMKTHPSWFEKRREIIKKLREIANDMNSDRFNCNVSRIVSTVASAAGGGCMLVSAVLLPFTGGLSASLGIVGGGLVAVGNLSNFGTDVAEVVRDTANVDEAQKLIKEDKELFEKIGTWVEHSEKLNKSHSEVLEIDILQDIISKVKKLVDKCTKIENKQERKRYIEENARNIILSTKLTINIPVIAIKTVIFLLMGIFLLKENRECRLLFACANLTVRALTGSLLLGFEFTELSACFDCSKATARAAARGAFAVIGLTLDIANIVLTSIDMKKGSLSSEAQKILELANEMEKEAKELEKVYNSLVNTASRFSA